MRNFAALSVVIAGSVLLAATAVGADALACSKPRFVFKDAQGKMQSAEIVTKYQSKKIVYPLAKVDPKVDPKLRRAATIAEERSHAQDRKSTRLNSSHTVISYAVFCLKKKIMKRRLLL